MQISFEDYLSFCRATATTEAEHEKAADLARQRLEYLDGQMILAGRLAATVNVDHKEDVLAALDSTEVAAFVETWSEHILTVCLDAGVTTTEVRSALSTGVLPDRGLVRALAEFRSRPDAPGSH